MTNRTRFVDRFATSQQFVFAQMTMTTMLLIVDNFDNFDNFDNRRFLIFVDFDNQYSSIATS